MSRSFKEVKKNKKTFADKLDNLIGVFAPEMANKRRFNRYSGQLIKRYLFSGYDGAGTNRLRSHWNPGAGSADYDLLPDLAKLRERSRDLNMNDPVASGITETVTVNDIGTGITPQSNINYKILGISEEQADEFQEKSEYEFEKWTSFADAGDRMNFYDIQRLIDRQMLESGEAFIIPLMIQDPNRPYSLALQVVEGDRVETPPEKRQDKRIRKGIKIGDRGQTVSIFIKKTHPGDSTLSKDQSTGNYMEITARDDEGRPNILHNYFVLRPGQSRGVPFFAPVLERFKDMADYLEAEIVAERIQACYAIFIESMHPYNAAQNASSGSNSNSQQLQEFEPGLIKYLTPGQKISSFKPERPGTTFEPFVELMLRTIGASLQLPYEIVAKDFSKTNYSSARAALLQAYKYFSTRQTFISRHFCQPIWELFLEEAYLKGNLPCDNFYKKQHDWTKCDWLPDGWEWVDPLKSIKAEKEAIQNGLDTYSGWYAKQGKDWKEEFTQIAREQKEIEDLAIELNVKSEKLSEIIHNRAGV